MRYSRRWAWSESIFAVQLTILGSKVSRFQRVNDMKPSDAIEWIRSTFTNPSETNQLAASISEEIFLSALAAIEKRLPYSEGPTGRAIQLFLYCGCIKFDRWLPPTPYVMPEDHKVNFDHFLLAMCLGVSDPNNAARFQADQIKWELVDFLHEKNPQKISIESKSLDCIKGRMNSISCPSLPGKFAEYRTIVEECEILIEAARGGKLRTVVNTEIPIIPVLSPLTVKTVWRDIQTTLVLTPVFVSPKNNMVSVEGDVVITPLTPSRWQHGLCEVQIEWEALIDRSAPSWPLSVNLPMPAPTTAWPQVYTDVFELLDYVIWNLRLRRESLNSDILEPSDLSLLEWNLFAGERKMDWVKIGSPGTPFRITNQKEPSSEIEIDITVSVPWHTKCYTLAEANLAKGKTNEAIFWINVATEAFLERRSKEICARAGVDYADLFSAECYWVVADEIVKRDLPDHAHLVQWPEDYNGPLSWFKKIKYLSKRVVLAENQSIICGQYGKIQRYRNALFHGENAKAVSAEDAEIALKAFAWVEENFCLAEDKIS